ncbi:glycosyltransferase involved in cell wall biosynthesis [Methanococcus maripaludis]|uniref:Glycosyltransferase involved in cell wall biosynthesis n=1 Tax=Methanococcus maripaludis TaxID=39152 RepID=A0A7J9NMI8_METMI|nr:glycosyltransferase family 2 protein [Methanococcus maripaludis]MBA2846644.1 glycosyltransferase involved in cell wall biosynthesis [Methanococcus maripaludis]
MKLSVIIPAYNEEKTVLKTLEEVVAVNLPIDKEIIVVNDGSTDKTEEIIENSIKKFPESNIKLLSKKNGGKGSALKEGIQNSTGELIIIQDADLEYDPSDYSKLIQPILEETANVVYGSRIKNKDNGYSHVSFLIGGIGVTLATNVLYGVFLTDEPTCYKVFHSDLKNILIDAEGNGFEWEPEITAKIIRKGHKIKEIPINYYPRTKKEGKKIKWSDGVKAVETLLKWRFKKIN